MCLQGMDEQMNEQCHIVKKLVPYVRFYALWMTQETTTQVLLTARQSRH
jgi:hypothetical protein